MVKSSPYRERSPIQSRHSPPIPRSRPITSSPHYSPRHYQSRSRSRSPTGRPLVDRITRPLFERIGPVPRRAGEVSAIVRHGGDSYRPDEHVPKVPQSGKAINLQKMCIPGGDVGTKVKVVSNQFEVASIPKGSVYVLSLSLDLLTPHPINPTLTPISVDLVPTLLQQPNFQSSLYRVFREKAVYDNKYTLYTSIAPPVPTIRINLVVGKKTYILAATKTGELDLQNLRNFINEVTDNKQVSFCMDGNKEAEDGLRFLKGIFSSVASSALEASKGDSAVVAEDGSNITIWPGYDSFNKTLESNRNLEARLGYIQDVVLFFGRLSVNLDVTMQPFVRAGVNCMVLLIGFLEVQVEAMKSGWSFTTPAEREKALSKMLGLGVITKHTRDDKSDGDNRIWKVIGWDTQGSSREFEVTRYVGTGRGGEYKILTESLSASKFFKNEYGITLKYPELPLLRCSTPGKPKSRYLPLEVCFAATNQVLDTALLSSSEKTEFLALTQKLTAADRRYKTIKHVQSLSWSSNATLESFGITASPVFYTQSARVLPPPALTLDSHQPFKPSHGNWELRTTDQLCRTPVIKSWGIMFFADPKFCGRGNLPNAVTQLHSILHVAMKKHGLHVPHPAVFQVANFQRSLPNAITKFYEKIKAGHDGYAPDLIVFALSHPAKHVYAEIKKTCDLKLGVPSQCIVLPTFQPSFAGNIVLKINAKLCGVNAKVIERYFTDQRVLVIGASRFTTIGFENKTYASVVCSYDKDTSRYTAATSCQPADTDAQVGKGPILHFPVLTHAVLARYITKMKAPPERVLYFRDCNSMLPQYLVQTLYDENVSLQELCGNEVPVTLIAVNTIHHTRFYPSAVGDSGNVEPGTVIENQGGSDFFMVSHVGNEGVSKPTWYVSMYDDVGIGFSEMQRVCYGLCYGVARSCGACSVVAPVRYAREACKRAALYAESERRVPTENSINRDELKLDFTEIDKIDGEGDTSMDSAVSKQESKFKEDLVETNDELNHMKEPKMKTVQEQQKETYGQEQVKQSLNWGMWWH